MEVAANHIYLLLRRVVAAADPPVERSSLLV
jgi:hypothetical protein